MTDKYDSPSAQILERKLSTILSADVAEYSRLMGEDEEQTLRTFRGHKKVFESLVAMHHGRIFNTAGDAILAEFASAVEAVRCATDIQAALRTRNDQLPANRQVRFRIGINLGDILVQGNDLMGDGVNVAARIQTAAEPGGICISGTVHDQIRNKLSLSFQSLGEMSFKNIQQPVRTFSITEAEGSGPLPSRQPATAAPRNNAKWIAIAAIAVLLVGGGIWAYTARRSSTTGNVAGATPAPQPQVALPAVITPNAEAAAPKQPPAAATAPAAAKTAPVAKAKPAPLPAATVPPVAKGPNDGNYYGQICFSKGNNDEGRCFLGEAAASGGKLSNKWLKEKEAGIFIDFSGDVASSGDATIQMHAKISEGGPVDFVLSGTLRDGLLTAVGNSALGRAVSLNLRKNPPVPADKPTAATAANNGFNDGHYSGQVCFGQTMKDPSACFHTEGSASGRKLNGKWPMGKDNGVFMTLTGDIDQYGNLRIGMYSKGPNGNILNNIYVFGTIHNGLMTASGSFAYGRAVTLNWHKD